MAGDRLLTAFARIIDLLQPRLLYLATWEYRVVSVSGTGPVTVSARAVASSCPLPDLSAITLWPGPSGAYAVPVPGSSVRVSFADGDPTKPMIVGLDPANTPLAVYAHAGVSVELGDASAALLAKAVPVAADMAALSTALAALTTFAGTCVTVPPGTPAVTLAAANATAAGILAAQAALMPTIKTKAS